MFSELVSSDEKTVASLSSFIGQAAASSLVSPAFLGLLALCRDVDVRVALTENPHLRPDIAEMLAADPREEVREAARQRTDSAHTHEVLTSLRERADTSDAFTRAHESKSGDELSSLARHWDPDVQEAAIRNPALGSFHARTLVREWVALLTIDEDSPPDWIHLTAIFSAGIPSPPPPPPPPPPIPSGNRVLRLSSALIRAQSIPEQEKLDLLEWVDFAIQVHHRGDEDYVFQPQQEFAELVVDGVITDQALIDMYAIGWIWFFDEDSRSDKRYEDFVRDRSWKQKRRLFAKLNLSDSALLTLLDSDTPACQPVVRQFVFQFVFDYRPRFGRGIECSVGFFRVARTSIEVSAI
ncbi:hypothetical protein E3N86_12220 [Cryobacterium sp. Hz7]|nr:hypothetical protein E3N86_12220 [Cryobacterium sp. Hz7]